MSTLIKLTVHGDAQVLHVDDPNMPLLYALRDHLGLHGLHFVTAHALAGIGTLSFIPFLLLLRLLLGSASYATGTPGELFAPLLVLGAELGLWFGKLCAAALPGAAIQPEGFAVVGMAALFAAIVRAPLTGIILVAEMTANVTMLLPMIMACFVAMLLPTLLKDSPIYESLTERLLVSLIPSFSLARV